MRSLLTSQVVLSTATYALLSLIDISYRAIQPVFYAEPRSLGGLGLPPSAIGTAMALLGLGNGVFQIAFFARLVKWWGVRKCYLIGIACAIPIFALFPIMSAVVHYEDRGQSLASLDTSTDEYEISVVLIALVALQLVLTVVLNLCYGSVFIYITAAAGIIPAPSLKSTHTEPPVSSSSSSATCVPSPSSSAPSLSTKLGDGSSKLAKRHRAATPSKGGRKTLGAVNGIAQMIVSIMRCIGPYCASSLYSHNNLLHLL